MFFMKEYRPNLHASSYLIQIFIFIYYFSWPGARTWYSGSISGSGQKFRLLAAPAPQHCHQQLFMDQTRKARKGRKSYGKKNTGRNVKFDGGKAVDS